MKTRIITGVVLVVALGTVLALSGTHVYMSVLALLSFVGAWEMLGCTGNRKNLLLSIPSLAVAFSGVILMYFFGMNAVVALCILYMFYVFVAAVFANEKIKTQDACVVFATVFYVIVCFSALLQLRYVKVDGKEMGQYIFGLVFIAAWITDTFAYFTGVFFGKHKLIPKVSPKKTVEGAIGGIVFCIIAFIVYGVVLSKIPEANIKPNYWGLAIVGLCTSVFSMFGDLLASAIKRSYGVKDYGNLFPGHGGVLDRFDSIMAVAPLLLMFAQNSVLVHFLLG